MNDSAISSCYITPTPSTEQFIPTHTFMYLVEGFMTIYDGCKEYKLKPGDYGIGKRNHLARYTKQPDQGSFKKIYISFDHEFLKRFNETYKHTPNRNKSLHAIIPLKKSKVVESFVQSILLVSNEYGTIDEPLLSIKRSELLLILLKADPKLGDIFFDFNHPGKIDLEKFMNANFKFNVSLKRFAFLTGRSLSTFKRDFKKIFKSTPESWLVKKRLEEAYYLIGKKNKKPSEIFIDLGFEDFSHFSFAFKKLFGHPPTRLNQKRGL